MSISNTIDGTTYPRNPVREPVRFRSRRMPAWTAEGMYWHPRVPEARDNIRKWLGEGAHAARSGYGTTSAIFYVHPDGEREDAVVFRPGDWVFRTGHPSEWGPARQPVHAQAADTLHALWDVIDEGYDTPPIVGEVRESMTLLDYQRGVEDTLTPEAATLDYLIPALAGEAGEVASLVAKDVRDNEGDGPDWDALLKELGDVLWMVAATAGFMGSTLDEVARVNLDKLADRKRRGVIGGSGDNR